MLMWGWAALFQFLLSLLCSKFVLPLLTFLCLFRHCPRGGEVIYLGGKFRRRKQITHLSICWFLLGSELPSGYVSSKSLLQAVALSSAYGLRPLLAGLPVSERVRLQLWGSALENLQT